MGFDRSWIKKVYRKIFYLECTILQVSCKMLLNVFVGCCGKIEDKFQASGKEAGGYGTGKHCISGGAKSDFFVYVEGNTGGG